MARSEPVYRFHHILRATMIVFTLITVILVAASPLRFDCRTAGAEGTAPEAVLSASTGGPAPLEIMAYCPVDYPGDPTGYGSLKSNCGHIDTVAAFLFSMDPSGAVKGSNDQRLLTLARAEGFRLQAVVHNFANGTFDAEMVRPFLVTLAGRGRAAQAITDLAVKNGYDGINIDFEGLPPELRDSFSLFIKNLAGRLKANGKSLSVAVPAKTRDNPRDSWSGAYDYAALAASADRLMIMAYDEHWVGGPAGPIASAGWVERVADYAVSAAPREKILLGVAQYSYDWPAGGGYARYITTPEAMRLAGETRATIAWDPVAQVPYYYYWRGTQKRVVYMENRYSLAFKLNIARSRGLAGIGLWRLGYEDPAIWDLIDKYR